MKKVVKRWLQKKLDDEKDNNNNNGQTNKQKSLNERLL